MKKVLVIGSGGREHALGWKIGQSSEVSEVIYSPGNGGTEEEKGRNISIDGSKKDNFPALLNFVNSEGIDMVVVGPEAPLAYGIVDYFNSKGYNRIFGPSQRASLLESDKFYSFDLMNELKLPQADSIKCYSKEEAIRAINERATQEGIVIKARGLTGGKGVLVCDSKEQALEIADNLIRSGAVDLIVVDSVAALTRKAEIEGEMGESKMGLQARLMSQALRKLTGTINKTGCCVIFINQLREKIGVMFGNPETTTGGNALKFYASVRLDIRRIGQLKDGDSVNGNRVRVKVIKNKVAPPFRMSEFDILFGEGISKVGEIIDLGVEHGVVKKSGSWFSYGDTKLGQGRDSVKQIFLDNPELAEEIEAKIKEALGTNNAIPQVAAEEIEA